jgi:hypothetical protein
MPTADPALGFWLRYAAREGALCDETDESAYVVLPDPLQAAFGLPEETNVTADPEVAREDGAMLVAPGHPALNAAADRVLSAGDAGWSRLAWPVRVPPTPDALLSRAREAFPVDHGRIDATGAPSRVLRPVLRVGALVDFTVSMDASFSELVECWVDARSGLELPERVRRALAGAEVGGRGGAGPGGEPAGARRAGGGEPAPAGPDERDERDERPAVLPPNLVRAIRASYQLIAERAGVRSADLAADVGGARDAEIARALAYYAEALASIERRRANAPPDRRRMLDARAEATRAERVRRVNEIREKYRSQLDIRPIRLHLVEVPALELPVDVLRGPRRYPMVVHWWLPAGAFADVRCPSCGRAAPLVAAKDRLGCENCLVSVVQRATSAR